MSAASTECSSSSTSQEEVVEKTEARKKAGELMAQGKRNMVCGEIPKAVGLYEEALKILVDNCGELSHDCADAYFNCGSSLLELGRLENSVLGNALSGVDVEDEKEEPPSEQFEKPPENGEEAKEEGEEQEEEEEEEDDAAEDVEVPDVATGEGSQGDENDKGGDDVGNFQLAWEHLDLAKVIYLKSDSKEDQLKAAECHMKLGELSMETENHEQAAEDLLAALKIQETHLPKDDRGIAETHYTLGLAFGLGKDFEKSVSHYQQAVTVIEARIASLNKLVEEKEVNPENKENQEDDPLKKYKDEIKDLQELIPEMQNKIEDAKVEQRDMAKMLEMAKAALGINIAPTGFSSTSKGEAGASSTSPSLSVDENGEKKASDIAHLVRKKRKPEDDEPADLDTKKICTDEKQTEVNGDAKKEDKINGQVEKSEEKAPAPEPMVS